MPSLPASGFVSMPLTQATKKDTPHPRSRLSADTKATCCGRIAAVERELRRFAAPETVSGSPHPSDERGRVLGRMSADHSFAPAIVRGMLAGAREDAHAADAAEREALSLRARSSGVRACATRLASPACGRRHSGGL